MTTATVNFRRERLKRGWAFSSSEYAEGGA